MGTRERAGPRLGEALPATFPWGHMQLRLRRQLYLRDNPPSGLLLGSRLEGALAAPCHAWVNVLPGLGSTCRRSCRGPCLPEGPPVLLLVFRGQPEAPLTPWLLVALLSHLELARSLLESRGCLTWQCSSTAGPVGALGLLQGLPRIEEVDHSLSWRLGGRGRTGLRAPSLVTSDRSVHWLEPPGRQLRGCIPRRDGVGHSLGSTPHWCIFHWILKCLVPAVLGCLKMVYSFFFFCLSVLNPRVPAH